MATNYSSSSENTSSDDEQDNFEDIQKLDLSHQELDAEMLNFHFNEHFQAPDRQIGLKKLVLSFNSLSLVPGVVQSLKNLVKLDVSNNVLTYLPEVLGTQLVNLTHLELRGNLISETEFPKDVSGLARNLKYLNMSGNRLNIIPPQFFQLTELTNLFLGANQIEEIPPEVKALRKLKFFYLGGNLLKKLPKEICHLEKLQGLILSFNRLESLPDCICRLKKLRVLQLHSNKLTTLPNGLIFLSSLTELSLRENPLVVRFVCEIDVQVSSLLELAARSVKAYRIPYSAEDLPKELARYLDSAKHCVNPKCCGVYFESRVEHIKFVDFCGKYRIPLMQYLCSVNCQADRPAVAIDDRLEETDKMKKVLLG